MWVQKVFKPPCIKNILTEKDITDIIGTLIGAASGFNDIFDMGNGENVFLLMEGSFYHNLISIPCSCFTVCH